MIKLTFSQVKNGSGHLYLGQYDGSSSQITWCILINEDESRLFDHIAWRKISGSIPD